MRSPRRSFVSERRCSAPGLNPRLTIKYSLLGWNLASDSPLVRGLPCQGAHFLISEWSWIKRKPISCSSFDTWWGCYSGDKDTGAEGNRCDLHTHYHLNESADRPVQGPGITWTVSFWSLPHLRGQVPLTSLNPRPPAGDTQSFLTVSSPLKLLAQMPFRIVLHTVFFIVFRLNQEYIQKKLNLNNFFWEFSRNLFAPQSLCGLFSRASDFVFFQFYADVATWFKKKGGGDNGRHPYHSREGWYCSSWIQDFSAGKAEKVWKQYQKKRVCMWSILPCRKDFEVFSLLPGKLCLPWSCNHFFFMLLVSCAQNKGGIADVIRDLQGWVPGCTDVFLNTFCSSSGQECPTTLNHF